VRAASDKARNVYPALSGTDHAQGMLIQEHNGVRVLKDDAEAVETADMTSDQIAGLKRSFYLYPGFPNLVEKLVLDIEMRFWHFPCPRANTPLPCAFNGPGRLSQGENSRPAIICRENE